MAKITRGFAARNPSTRDSRLPPGQYDAGDTWPVLSAEVTPTLPTAEWSFTIDGLVEEPTSWTWDEIHDLPSSTYTGDIHCVTAWSKFGMTFTGVSIDTLLDVVTTSSGATHAMAVSHTGYTTNLPIEDLTDGKAWVAWEVDGEPLSADHGGPARLLVPHLYFWKSAKWIAGLQILDHDEPGFWEANGYHDHGDPWKEERYQGD